MEQQLVGHMVTWHDHISSVTPRMGQLDVEDPLYVDEETMDDLAHIFSYCRTHNPSYVMLIRCIMRVGQ